MPLTALLDVVRQLLPEALLQRLVFGDIERGAGDKVHLLVRDHLGLLDELVADEKHEEEGDREVGGDEAVHVEGTHCGEDC